MATFHIKSFRQLLSYRVSGGRKSPIYLPVFYKTNDCNAMFIENRVALAGGGRRIRQRRSVGARDFRYVRSIRTRRGQRPRGRQRPRTRSNVLIITTSAVHHVSRRPVGNRPRREENGDSVSDTHVHCHYCTTRVRRRKSFVVFKTGRFENQSFYVNPFYSSRLMRFLFCFFVAILRNVSLFAVGTIGPAGESNNDFLCLVENRPHSDESTTAAAAAKLPRFLSVTFTILIRKSACNTLLLDYSEQNTSFSL